MRLFIKLVNLYLTATAKKEKLFAGALRDLPPGTCWMNQPINTTQVRTIPFNNNNNLMAQQKTSYNIHVMSPLKSFKCNARITRRGHNCHIKSFCRRETAKRKYQKHDGLQKRNYDQMRHWETVCKLNLTGGQHDVGYLTTPRGVWIFAGRITPVSGLD